LIRALPEVATHPDLTALWESQLSAINDGRGSYHELMTPLQTQLASLVDESRNVTLQGLQGLGANPSYRRRKRRKPVIQKR